MKTKLSVAAMALLLASCSSNDNDLLPENPVNATPIQVSQSVQGMVKTRAAVGVGSDVTATVLVADGDQAADWTKFSPVLANEVKEDGGQNKLTTRATVSTASFKAAALSASVFSFFFLGTDCSTLDFFGGERVFLVDDSSLMFSFGLLISARPPRSR